MPDSNFVFQVNIARGTDPWAQLDSCLDTLRGSRKHMSLRAEVFPITNSERTVQVVSADPTHSISVIEAECIVRVTGSLELVVPFDRDNSSGAYIHFMHDLWIAYVIATELAASWGSLIRARRASWPEGKWSGAFSTETALDGFIDALGPLGVHIDRRRPQDLEGVASSAYRFLPEPSPWAKAG